MSLFDRTVRCREYQCQSCAWAGQKTDFVYTGKKKGVRTCPDCGGNVKRVSKGAKEWTGLAGEAS
jgi:predicted nucleic acid-binding Zn ribbon protein